MFNSCKKSGNGFIEIQLTIPRNYIGSDIPIKVNFDNYKKKGVNVVGAAVGEMIVPVLGIGIATYSYLKNSEAQTAQIEEKFSDIKKKYENTKYSQIRDFVFHLNMRSLVAMSQIKHPCFL